MLNSNNKIKKDLIKHLGQKLSFKNPHQAPRVFKVVVSCGIGDIKEDQKAIESVLRSLSVITGQKPMINLSKKSVSAFKLRINQQIGLTVTLRSGRMNDFLSRLTNVAMPRIKDFKGLSDKSFDGKGNYCMGVSEHVIMPEIKYDTLDQAFGFQVNICTTTDDNKKAKKLLCELGFQFEKITDKKKYGS